jgi:transposase
MGTKDKAGKGEAKAGVGGTQGGRRPTGVPPTESGVTGPLAPNGRWSVGRKREVVLRLLHGESMDAVSREVGVEIYRLEKWREEALAGMDARLKRRREDPVQAELDTAMKRIGELTMENELLWRRVRSKVGPLARRRSPK